MEPPLLDAIMQIEKLTEGLLWPGDADSTFLLTRLALTMS